MKLNSVRQTLRSAFPFLIILGLLAFAGYRIRFAPVPVRAQSATVMALTNEVVGTGTLEAHVKTSISPKIQGRVVSITVDQSDTIHAGQVLVQLDDGELREMVEVAAANLGAAEASVERVKADRERVLAIAKQARRDYERISELLANKVASESDLDKAVERLGVAEADLKRSESATLEAQKQFVAGQRNLQYQRERLKDTQILSPFDGLVLKRNRDPGDVVVPGSSILDIISTNELWLSAWVDETVLSDVEPGQPARVIFRSEPGKSFSGAVARIARETDRETRELLVDVKLSQLPANWAVGQRGEVYIQTSQKSAALTVPAESIQWKNGRPGLFVMEKGRARWKEVQTGVRAQNRVEVLGGISERDQVFVEEKRGGLRDGKRIRIL
jgi:HlyD family secretion protein